MKKHTVGSFFAGVGGIDIGFEQTNKFEIVYANEIDIYPARTYEENFKLNVDVKDINLVKGNEIPDFEIMVGGFPCQAFSLAGYRQGFDDEKGRGTLFFQMMRIIEEKKANNQQPRVVFFENVKNLVGHDNGNTFRVIIEQLSALGYNVIPQVLNACEYGNIPQNRERIYIVGFLNEDDYKKYSILLPVKLTTRLSEIIDFNNKKDDKYYYTPECKFYDTLLGSMNISETIYQWRRIYVRENKSNVCPTLTANMGTGGHNVPLIRTIHGIRKLTPRECFSLQGFPETYKLPDDICDSRLFKQAGNSVVVSVISRIAKEISIAIT